MLFWEESVKRKSLGSVSAESIQQEGLLPESLREGEGRGEVVERSGIVRRSHEVGGGVVTFVWASIRFLLKESEG